MEIIRITDEEIVRISKEAVKEAVIPLMVEIEGLKYKIDCYKTELKRIKQDSIILYITICIIGITGGLLLGIILE
jgi:hypothetical protein